MIEEDFYATVKLKTGEEIFAKVAASAEEDRTMLIVSNPVIISEIKSSKLGVVGYKLEPWLKTTSEDLFIIKLEDVLTMTESSDIEMIVVYQNYLRQSKKEGNNSKINRRMGYLANVNDAKEILEKIFKGS
jgi:hypothetical protein